MQGPDWIKAKWRMAAAILGALAALLVAPVRAESLEALNQQTLELFQSNKFAEANAAAERAAAEARARFGDSHADYARALSQQANTLFMLRRYGEAEPPTLPAGILLAGIERGAEEANRDAITGHAHFLRYK